MASESPYRSAGAVLPSVPPAESADGTGVWRKAHLDLRNMGRAAAIRAAPVDDARASSVQVSADGRIAVFVSRSTWQGEACFVRTQTLEPIAEVTVGGGSMASELRFAVSADGRRAVFAGEDLETKLDPTATRHGDGVDGIMVVDVVDGEASVRVHPVDAITRFGGGSAALHPTKPIVALADDHQDNVTLVDYAAGRKIITHSVRCHRGLRFSPDGEALVVSSSYGATVFDNDGGRRTIEATDVWWSRDGRRLALFWSQGDDTLAVFDSEPRVLDRGKRPKRGVRYAREGMRQGEVLGLAFSPDGARIAVQYYEALPEWRSYRGALAVFDAAELSVIARGGNPLPRPPSMGRYRSMGFDAAGRHVIGSTSDFRSLHAEDDSATSWWFDVAGERFTGTVGCEPHFSFTPESPDGDDEADAVVEVGDLIEEGHALVARASNGLFGRLASDAPLDGKAAQVPFERPADARAWLVGGTLGLDPALEVRLRDLHRRYRFFADLVGAGEVAEGTAVRSLVAATCGFTDMLPWVHQRALEVVGSGASFGGAAPTAIDTASVAQAVAELSALDAAELESTYTQQLSRVASGHRQALVARQAAAVAVTRRKATVRIAAGSAVALALALVFWLLLG